MQMAALLTVERTKSMKLVVGNWREITPQGSWLRRHFAFWRVAVLCDLGFSP
jgi:hypothetical protein